MTTIKTTRGEREYPSKQDYIAACVLASRKPLAEAHRSGHALEQSSVRTDAHVSRQASEHYDMATVRGEDLRTPEKY